MWTTVVVCSIILSTIVMGAGVFLSTKKSMSLALSSPFECGFTPKSEALPPISVHFFVVGLVFLVFDVELVILFPFMISFSMGKTLTFFILFSVLNFLSIGLFYEWSSSMLEWLS